MQFEFTPLQKTRGNRSWVLSCSDATGYKCRLDGLGNTLLGEELDKFAATLKDNFSEKPVRLGIRCIFTRNQEGRPVSMIVAEC